MDRPIEKRARNIKLLRRYGPSILIAAAAMFALSAFFGWIKPSVRRGEIRTAVVARGTVEATITASGTVVPEYEHVITSPIETRVTRILKTPGDEISAGEPVVELDVGEARLALDKLNDQIALKRVERKRAGQDLEGKTSEWRNQIEIKTLELEYLDFEAKRCREYLDEGLYTQDDLRKAEKDAERARIELRQIKDSMKHAAQANQTELDRLDLELAILEKERDEAAHRLALATAAPDRNGVVTWTVASEGVALHRGDEIARVADLTAFRVEATVSDVHGQHLAPGLPAVIRSGDTSLRGRVSNVRPTVENGVITMEISLEDKRHAVLRHNLRVEVYVVTASENNTLRIKRGRFLTVDGAPVVFVARDGRAHRTEVEFGLKSYEYYQVLEGLAEGDEVILTSMEDHVHSREVKIK